MLYYILVYLGFAFDALERELDDAQAVEGSTETWTLGLTDPYLFTYPHAIIK